jgi:hypothetical protein
VVLPFRFSAPTRIIVWDTLIAVASPDRYHIARYDAAGRLVSVIQVSASRRPVTQAMRTAEIATRIAVLHQPAREQAVDMAESERIARAVPFVDSLPPYSDVLVSTDKMLWVVDAIAPGDTSWSATAFRLDGTIAKRLRAPMSGTPIAFGNDRVLVKRADDDGIISLEVYQFRARQGRGRR